MAQRMDDDEPKPADLIEISRVEYQHWTIYIGDGNVIHLVPASEEACGGTNSMMSVSHDKAIVKIDSLWHVVGTSKFSINNLLDDKYEPRSVGTILKDARSRVGQELPYDATRYCERFVTELRYGKPKSRQVRDAAQTAEVAGPTAIGVGLLGVVAVAAFAVMRLVK